MRSKFKPVQLAIIGTLALLCSACVMHPPGPVHHGAQPAQGAPQGSAPHGQHGQPGQQPAPRFN